jgi:hypothetical protein
MRKRHVILRSGLVLLAAWAACVQAAEPQHTWSGVERVVAVGDVHGDFDQFVKTLRAAGVIDRKLNWSSGKTHLVQIGDVLDRGLDSRKVMDLLMKLEVQAAEAGGAVHALIGNHEEMVLRGDWRYVNADEKKSFGGEAALREAMAADGKYGQWIRGHNAVIKINDVLFLHGGLSPKYAGKSLDELNRGIRDGLGKGGMGKDSAGPLWYRRLAWDEESTPAEQVDTILRNFGVGHVVVGHTVLYKIATRHGGKIILIDVGMSRVYGGPACCLEIEKGRFFVLTAGQPKAELKMQPAAGEKSPRP